MLGNHKGCLYIGSTSVGDLYGLKIAIAFLIQSLDLFAQFAVGFPNLLGEETSPNYDRGLSANYGHGLHKCQHALR